MKKLVSWNVTVVFIGGKMEMRNSLWKRNFYQK
jgi:hypothetical protein